MKRISIFLIVIITLTIPIQAEQNEVNVFYKETFEGFSRINGQNYRWDSEREFLLVSWEPIHINISGSLVKALDLVMLDDTTTGQPEHVIQEFSPLNFVMNTKFLENGTFAEITWDILMYRNLQDSSVPSGDPFTYEENLILTLPNHKRFDLRNTMQFFSVNLEYYEIIENVDGDLVKLKVNTDLATNNDETGRATRTSIHIIKRDLSQNVVFEYSRMIQEVTTVHVVTNYLDQTFIRVPLQVLSMFAFVYVYARVYRYVKENNIKIIKGSQKA
jgi:hypothetical protein